MERRSGQNKTDVSGWQPEAETWSGKTEYGHKKTRFRKRKYFLTVFLVVMYLEAAAGDSFCQYLVSHCQRQLADWLYILFNHMVRLIRKPLHSVFRGFLILRVYHKNINVMAFYTATFVLGNVNHPLIITLVPYGITLGSTAMVCWELATAPVQVFLPQPAEQLLQGQ